MSQNKPNKAIGPQVREKNHSKINRTLVLLVICSFLISMHIGTQFFAHQFHYADALGGTFAPIYMPWQIFTWAIKYQPYYPDSFNAAFGL
ncbi:TPA: conjugal transfer protein TraG, partial [Legionella pneumophila]|nr:conjugal transfer protein TraG [Legionella pneumophila]